MVRCIVIVALTVAILGVAGLAFAAPAGYTQYFVPGNEQLIADMYRHMYQNYDMLSYTMRLTAITMARDNTRVYYDHWEDGYDLGLEEYPPRATQSSTEIYDGNFGDTFVFHSRFIPVDNTGYPPPEGSGRNPVYKDTTNISGYPQHQGNYPYDGRDQIVSAGAPTFAATISGIHWEGQTIFPNQDSWELFPRKPLSYSYTMIHGVDLSQSPTNYEDFVLNYLFVTATEDDTVITIDDPAEAGAEVVITLDAGECYLYDGGSGGNPYNFHTGTTVVADDEKSIMVNSATSIPTEDVVANFFVALPASLLGNDYVTSLPAQSQIYIHNPNPTDIDLQLDYGSGPVYGDLPAGATLSIAGLFSVPTPANVGIRLRSLPLEDGPVFQAMGVGDTGDPAADSGWTIYSAVGDEYFVPIGMENFTTTIDDQGNPIYVTPTVDNTTFYVDYDHDGTVDSEFTANAYQSFKIWDGLVRLASNTTDNPGFDGNDTTGANIFASAPFAAMWAQAPDESIADNYNFIDAAYTISPMIYDFMNVSFNVEKEPDREATCEGQTVAWNINAQSFMVRLRVFQAVDTLPAHWEYVPGSGTYTVPDRPPVSIAPTTTWVGDQQRLTFVFVMPMREYQVGQITFDTVVHGETGTVYNTARALALDAGNNTLASDDRGFIVVGVDTDGDLICDPVDNCVNTYNPGQEDWNDDGEGDACDDTDLDGIFDDVDNCVTTPNPNQEDWNSDGEGDACDDTDDDGVFDDVDNCVTTPNSNQEDWNDDGEGDVCDDTDQDGIFDSTDNCVTTYNPGQADWNDDGEGDACDDSDEDTIFDDVDNCLLTPNTDQTNNDTDELGDACDNCPYVDNQDQADGDADGVGTVCDNCPDVFNPDQKDSDGNGVGDACETGDDDDDTADDDAADDDTADDDAADDDAADDDAADDDAADDDAADDDAADDDAADDDAADDDAADDDTADDDAADDDTADDDAADDDTADDDTSDDDTASDDDTNWDDIRDDDEDGDDDTDTGPGDSATKDDDGDSCCGCG